jgi:NADH dehydrogenase
MILVTGGTGFIGQAVIRQLVENGYAVRALVRPSRQTPNLPKQVPVEVALGDIADPESIRAALVGVDTIIHLVGGEFMGADVDLSRVDVRGTRTVVEAAQAAGAERILFISHIGADRGSAYPVFKAKGIAEEFIRDSGLTYTILRSSLVFGPDDHFTTDLVEILRALPLFLLPSQGRSLLQPIWVEDLATCLMWALENEEMQNKVITVGGPEFLTIRQIINEVLSAAGMRRLIVNLHASYLRMLTIQLAYFLDFLPISTYWLDYLAINRTTTIDSVSRQFGLLPSRLVTKLTHLKKK